MKHAKGPRRALLTTFIALALASLLVGVVAAATVTGIVIDAHSNEPRP
jgi:hypothetical protein